MILLLAYLTLGAVIVYGISWSGGDVYAGDLFVPSLWLLAALWPLVVANLFLTRGGPRR